jgi:hypothetical protein
MKRYPKFLHFKERQDLLDLNVYLRLLDTGLTCEEVILPKNGNFSYYGVVFQGKKKDKHTLERIDIFKKTYTDGNIY